jgi:hypothetical protein
VKNKFINLFGFLVLICFLQCQKDVVASATSSVTYDSVPLIMKLTPQVNSISGIADSKINSGFLWAQEDSGNPPKLHLIKHDGSLVKSIYLKGISNRDWEDMTIANNDIYLAETGDNGQSFTEYKFFIFPEPASSVDTVTGIKTVKFSYPDGSHDSEAFLVDPSSKDIYIITKRDNPSKIYRLPYPYVQTTVSFVGDLPYTGVVGAAISPDGNDVVIKTYIGLLNYKKKAGETIIQTLKKSYTKLPYTLEPQGEAVTFAQNNSGYFTLSEKGFGNTVNLFFYKRK